MLVYDKHYNISDCNMSFPCANISYVQGRKLFSFKGHVNSFSFMCTKYDQTPDQLILSSRMRRLLYFRYCNILDSCKIIIY